MKANGQGAIQETAFAVASDASKLEQLLTVEELAELLKVPGPEKCAGCYSVGIMGGRERFVHPPKVSQEWVQ